MAGVEGELSYGICRSMPNKAHSYPEGKWRDHKKSGGSESYIHWLWEHFNRDLN